jgi:thioredoxin 1
MALHITDESLKEILKGGEPVVLDLWAEWCGPCRMIGPVIEELAKEYEGKVVIGKLNVDENDQTSLAYGVRNIPTILFFKGGEVVDKHVGTASRAILKAKIEKLL